MEKQNQSLRVEAINFIKKKLYPPPNINQSTNLSQIIDMLNQVIKDREIVLHPDNWEDDEILGLAQDYIYELIQQNEEQNIVFTKNVSRVMKKGRTTKNTNIPPIPDSLVKKIQSYGVEEPYNSKSEFAIVNSLGGKTRKSRKLRKSRKSRKNKRKTRKHRK